MVRSVALGPTLRRAAGLAFWCPATGGFEADAENYARLAFDRRTDHLREHLLAT